VGVDHRVDRRELVLVQLVGPQVGADLGLRQDVGGELVADPVDVLEREEDLLLVRNVDTGDTWHALTPGPACAWGPTCRSPAPSPGGAGSGTPRRSACRWPCPSRFAPFPAPRRGGRSPRLDAAGCPDNAPPRRARIVASPPPPVIWRGIAF